MSGLASCLMVPRKSRSKASSGKPKAIGGSWCDDLSRHWELRFLLSDAPFRACEVFIRSFLLFQSFWRDLRSHFILNAQRHRKFVDGREMNGDAVPDQLAAI